MFGRLFSYARGTGSDQLENFTTEALAATIRSDPQPFLRVLVEQGFLQTMPTSNVRVLVTTQEIVAATGIVDLVLRLFRNADLLWEFWVEIKVQSRVQHLLGLLVLVALTTQRLSPARPLHDIP